MDSLFSYLIQITNRRGKATLWREGETTVIRRYILNVVLLMVQGSGGGDAMSRRIGRGNEM